MQSRLRLRLPPVAGVPRYVHAINERVLNAPEVPSETVKQRFAAHLKRTAEEAMRAITICPPGAVPMAVARINDIDGLISFAVAHGLVDEGERDRSDTNPIHAHTLGDFRLALDAARQTQRAPAFVSATAAELSAINSKLDLLASLLAAQTESEAFHG